MKKIVLSGIFISLFLSSYTIIAATKSPEVGSPLPEIILSVPQKPEHQKYLGLSGEGKFTIPKIKAKVVLIEIFSMYCPHCQGNASIVNEFYRKIENDKNLKEKIKLIGIGAGNSSYEVDVFKKKYNIKFPLFPDGDYSIHKMVGEVRTPYFIGVKIGKGGANSIFYSRLGGIENPDKFISLILQLSGL
jgi:thiol-disulfide isomerase/thioredoxin